MAQKLKNLTATRVALVDRGANQEADVVLFKRDPPPLTLESIAQSLAAVIGKMYDEAGMPMPEPAQTFDEVVAEMEAANAAHELHEAVCPLLHALKESVHSIINDPETEGKAALVQESADQFMSELKDALVGKGVIEKAATKTEAGAEYPAAAYAYVPDPEKPSTWKLRLWETPDKKETAAQVGRAMAAMGRGFRGNKVQIPATEMAAVRAKVRAAWRKTNPDMSMSDMPAVLKGEQQMELTQEQFDALKAEVVQATAKIGELSKALESEKARAGTAEAALETANKELAKVAPPKTEMEKRLAILPEEVSKAIRAEVEGYQKRVEMLEERDAIAKFDKIAREDYPNLPGSEKGRVLKAVDSLPDFEKGELMKLLKGANEAYGQMFGERGTSAAVAALGGSAVQQLNAVATELRKSDPKLTEAAAFLKAYNENPKLARQYHAEQANRA